jgi:hypothetical protein
VAALWACGTSVRGVGMLVELLHHISQQSLRTCRRNRRTEAQAQLKVVLKEVLVAVLRLHSVEVPQEHQKAVEHDHLPLELVLVHQIRLKVH